MPSLLQRSRGILALRPPGNLLIDAAIFAAAATAALRDGDRAACEAALRRYGGELLPDDRYEDWAVNPREVLSERHLELLDRAACLALADGDGDSARRHWQETVRLAPSHEAAHVALMRHYASIGQRVQALAQFGLLREILRRELEVEPSAESQRLYAAILAGRFVADTAPRAAPERFAIERFHNLPASTTALIGRDHAIAAVRSALDGTRLVTLTGAGGVGKTRLALAVGWDRAEEADRVPGGVWLLDLTSLHDGARIPGLLAATLGLHERGDQPLRETIVARLGAQPTLLLLDNCEHLIGACAEFAATLLARCPGLRILATSREALRVAGEQVWRVPSLALPDQREEWSSLTLTTLGDTPAIRLFTDRARLVRPDFALTAANARPVAAICHRLDGIPLALELAAARVAVLAPQQLAERLDDALRVLTGGPRTAAPRHQTLRATLEWSYHLLTPDERALLDRLAVFVGGWTLGAAEAICGLGAATLDLLAALVDKSLVQVEPGGGAEDEPRYRLLETIRQFAAERFAAEADAYRQAHADHFRQFATMAEPHLFGPNEVIWRGRIERDLDNLRAALAWYAVRDDVTALLQSASTVYYFWLQSAYCYEGLRWLNDGLARNQSDVSLEVRARALYAAAALESQGVGDWGVARGEESLALYRFLEDTEGQARCHNLLARAPRRHGEWASARAHLEQALAQWRSIGDTQGVFIATINLCVLRFQAGEQFAAFADYVAIMSAVRERGSVALWGTYQGNLCVGLLVMGRSSEVPAQLIEAITALAAVQNWPELQLSFSSLALLAAQRGDAAVAAQALGASDKLQALTMLPPLPYHAELAAAASAVATGALGEAAFAAARDAGYARMVEESVAAALTYLAPLAAAQAEAARGEE